MADDLANATRIRSRAAERLSTEVSNTVESNSSSSVAAPVTAGPSRADEASRMEVEFKSLFPHHFHQPSRFINRRNAATNNQRRSKKQRLNDRKIKAKNARQSRKFVCLSYKD